MIVTVSHNWLKDYLGENLPSPEKTAELFTAHAFEVEEMRTLGDDTLIDLKVLPDRGSDCLSVFGIARELSAILGVGLKSDPLKAEPTLPTGKEVTINIPDKDLCPRFAIAYLTGVKVGPSPEWLVDRLKTMGQRSINNVVDVTNYIMYELGQPLHAYDADLFVKNAKGSYEFLVRGAEVGEEVVLLPEKPGTPDRKLTLIGGEALILNGANKDTLALAGVKGGVKAILHEGTTNILLEAAKFNPTSISKTSRRYNLLTEASKRFENELADKLMLRALERACALMNEVSGAKLILVTDEKREEKEEPEVQLTIERINSVLGLSLTTLASAKLLEQLGVKVRVEGDTLVCSTPWWRTDLKLPEDYIEEIGRLAGLHNVVSIKPNKVELKEYNKTFYHSEQVRQLLLSFGFSEVITSAFAREDLLQLRNAVASDESFMRSNLRVNLADALQNNIQHVEVLGLKQVKIFEIGHVFFPDQKTETGIREELHLALGVRTKKSEVVGADDKSLAAVLSALQVLLGQTLPPSESGILEINLGEIIAKLNSPTTYEPIGQSSDITYCPFSSYPALVRDVAFWTKIDSEEDSVEAILKEEAGELLLRIDEFDRFEKEGKISLAFRLVFQAKDRTLLDSEIDPIMSEIYQKLTDLGHEIR